MKYFLFFLPLSVILLGSCNKDKDNSPENSGVKTGTYIGVVLLTSLYSSDKFGSTSETVTLKHQSGNNYMIVPNNKKLPNIKVEFKDIGSGNFGLFIKDGQKCSLGSMKGEPMSSFGWAYSGVYDSNKNSISIGFYPDYAPEIGLGGILVSDEAGELQAFMQIVITKK